MSDVSGERGSMLRDTFVNYQMLRTSSCEKRIMFVSNRIGYSFSFTLKLCSISVSLRVRCALLSEMPSREERGLQRLAIEATLKRTLSCR